MTYDLDRFREAQDNVFAGVLDELRRGRKSSHWMWFIFPQIAGLGTGATSQHYAIASLEEARAYIADPILGSRLRECAAQLLATSGRNAEESFGPIDARKLRSCMTLFHRAAPDEAVFKDVLARYFDGVADPQTDRLLGAEAGGGDSGLSI